MNDAASQTPPPRAYFNVLPLEIKARVVELAYHAELRREDALKRRNRLVPAFAGQLPQKLPRKPKDVDSLCKVNRELAALCAVHLFSTLRSDRTSEQTFRFAVLSRHAKCIKTVILKTDVGATSPPSDVDAATAHLSYTLSILPFLPSLSALQMNGRAITALRKRLEPDEWEGALRHARGITSLSVHALTKAQAIDLLPRFADLRVVSIVGRGVFAPDHGAEQSLVGILARMSLDCLELVPIYAPSSSSRLMHFSLGDGVGTRQWASATTLRSLSVSINNAVDAPAWAFIQQFSTSLVSLSIDMDTFSNTVERPPPLSLPHLNRLLLMGSPHHSSFYRSSPRLRSSNWTFGPTQSQTPPLQPSSLSQLLAGPSNNFVK